MEEYLTSASHLITAITLAFSAYQYFDKRSIEARQRKFDQYHKLIKELVQPSDEGIFLERQAAVIFELRNFSAYYPVTLRTLNNLREQWQSASDYPRLETEISDTIKYIEERMKHKLLLK